GEELVFAEITAVVRIGQVIGVVKFGGLDDANRKTELRAERKRLLQFTPGQTRGISDYRQRFLAQNFARDARQENRIHAARIGDKARTVGAKERAELVVFV